jgi:ATP/maltotriose-dependent transcriptional regulator MalT
MRTADGWPAVLGLAAMSGDVDFTSSRLLSHTLYEFLASELLAAASEETQAALMLLAVASIRDVDVARSVLGATAEDTLEDAVARGLVAVTDQKSLSLHPLLRDLLIQRFEDADAETRGALLSLARKLVQLRRWDEALSASEVANDAAFATEAIGAALDDLLAAGRTSSLQRWVASARAAGAEGGLIDYAESEASLRSDELDRAMALATQAASALDGDLAARAHVVAGRSAHLADRWQMAEKHADSAASLARTQTTREAAFFMRFLAGLGSESPDLQDRLDHYRHHARSGIQQSMRLAGANLSLAELEGGYEQGIDDARCALSLADETVDPMAHTGLLSMYSYALILTCRYEESLKQIETLQRVAESCGLEFPIPYAHIHRAKALIGLGRFTPAARALSTLERRIGCHPNSYLLGNLPIARARLYASVGDPQRALDVLSPGPVERSTKTVRGEHFASQALLYAATREPNRAQTFVADARNASRALEPRVLSLLAEAILALGQSDADAAAARLQFVIDSGIWDPVVIALRAAPELGVFLAEQADRRSWLQRLLSASSDTSLANRLGLGMPRGAKRPAELTPRESEVHELVAQGRTNEEIAKQLYISLSTTKVHVKHIYEKLGVRSRLEAARALRDDV